MKVRSMNIAALAVCMLPLVTVAQLPPPDDREIVRIAINKVPPELADELDPCAIDREADGAYAVFFLEPDQVNRLIVEHQRVGKFTDYAARFFPANTMRRKAVPSMERLIASLPSPPAAGTPGTAGQEGGPLIEFDEYHTLQEGMDFLYLLQSLYPDIAKVITIGQTVQGRPILALKITDLPNEVEPNEERILFTGLTHAREWATHEVMLNIAYYLATNYAVDEDVRHIVDNSVIWLVPAVNPDGYQYTWDVDRLWRKNRRAHPSCLGVDLNRNFDYRWGEAGSSPNPCIETYRGPSAASEPETQAMQNLMTQQRFAIAVSYHTYGQMVLYPWGGTELVRAQAHTSHRAIADKYAGIIESLGQADYRPGQGSFTLYIVSGDFNEYAYARHGALALTPEQRPATSTGGGFLLPESLIAQNNAENLAAALWLMRNVADVTTVTNPTSSSLFGQLSSGDNMVSLPATPVNQRPEWSLGFNPNSGDTIETWLDDPTHQPPLWGGINSDFEAMGSGGGYIIDPAPASNWLSNLTSYRALPHVFEDGARVMLSNVNPGMNIVGVPGAEQPILLRSVNVLKRRQIPAQTGGQGTEELVVMRRTALEDLDSDDPWISWNWEFVDSAGVSRLSHPTGAQAASPLLEPFRAYLVDINLPSWNFPSNVAFTYMLEFPGSRPDCNLNGLDDDDEIDALTASDCNHNRVPDECEWLGDFDADGRVDLSDYQQFFDCVTAPGVEADLSCTRADIDADTDVDMIDFACFSRLFTGACALNLIQSPVDVSVCPHADVSFTVQATGDGLTYQWYRSGSSIDGATASTLVLQDVSTLSSGNYRVAVSGPCETIFSESARLTVTGAPSILAQPQDTIGCDGVAATLSVTASGVEPLSFQWQHDGVDVPGANQPVYAVGAMSAEATGTYLCAVADACGSLAYSLPAELMSQSAHFDEQPQGENGCEGDFMFLIANVSAPATMQWFKNNVAIPGATLSYIIVPHATPSDAGTYRVVATNSCGSTTSQPAVVSVTPCDANP